MKAIRFFTVILFSFALAACSGKGGSSSASSATPATVAISVTPAMGTFQDGSTVKIFNNLGTQCGTGKTSGGVATISITTSTCQPPLIVQAGIAGDQYFDEATNALVAITGTGIRAVVPSASYTSIGVTPLTEIAAAGLINTTSGGLNNGVTAASVTAENVTIAKLLSNGNVTDPLAVPAAASSASTKATNAYGAILAMLSDLVPGQTPQAITNNLALDLSKGTWSGTTATGAPIPGAILPSSFGAAMAAAASAVAADINSTAAPTIAITSTYVPTANVASAVAAVSSGGTIPTADPYATARSLFTSLRTNANLLANPGKTGFLDTQLTAANTTLTNSVLPQVNKVSAKLDMLLQAHELVRAISNYGTLSPTPLVYNPSSTIGSDCSSSAVSCSGPAIDSTTGLPITGYTYFQNVNSNNKLNFDYFSGAVSYCSATILNTNVPSTNASSTGGTAMPAGITVSCLGEVDAPTFDISGNVTDYLFDLNVTTVSHQPNVAKTYTTTSTSDTYSGLTATYTTGAAVYSGAATISYAGNLDAPKNLSFTGDLAANGITYDHDSVTLNLTRTGGGTTTTSYVSTTHALTGNITSYTSPSASSGSISLLPGTLLTRSENSVGATPLPLSSGIAGESAVVVLRASTASTQIDGTLSISNFACDISATSCGPQNASFTGSLTNLANTAVGTFANLTITDTLDYSGFNGTLTQTNANSVKTTGSIVGTITNNTVTPVATYQFTLNGSTTNANPNQFNVGLIYQDPSATVSATAVLDTTPSNTSTNTINLTSGAILAVLQSNNTAGTTTGNVYEGSASPANLIGTYDKINGVDTISFNDGTTFSIQ